VYSKTGFSELEDFAKTRHKIGYVVQSAVASCTCCTYAHPEIRSADRQKVAYRCRDYVHRELAHAQELGRWWQTAVKST
jgi:hypothetical protein